MKHPIRPLCQISIGLDLGDKQSYVVVMKRGGEIEDERKVSTTRSAIRKYFKKLKVKSGRVVMEACGQSAWVCTVLEELGYEVVVANPSSAGAILRGNGRKNDKRDATLLAGLGFDNAFMLNPIKHRGEESQRDLMILKARDALVRSRNELVNSVRSHTKCMGYRITTCSTDTFHRRARKELPSELQAMLSKLIDQIESLTDAIKQYKKDIEKLCREKYPVTQKLQAITGVGPITALTFVLVLEEPRRFSKSRKVGAFLGLVPGQHESGESSPQLRISKQGNGFLRKHLVTAAHYILGHYGPDCDLRRLGERLAASGGKRGKKRAVVAVARRLAVLLHKLWVSGEDYDPHYSQRAA